MEQILRNALKQLPSAARRNPRYNQDGVTIDCEIEHPIFGWIPFTANPDDPEEHGRLIHADIVANGNPAPHLPPQAGGGQS